MASSTARSIYRIVTEQAWMEAQARGAFTGTAHDLRDGFIHFSSAEQVAETAAKHYRGQAQLLLLWVDADAIASALRWEPSRGGALFPHLYAELPISAVKRVTALPLDERGEHVFPPDLE